MQFETDRQRIVGDVTLPPEGYQSRFSDSLNRPEVAFIPLVNVEISSLMGGDVERLPLHRPLQVPRPHRLSRSTPSSSSVAS